MLLFDRMQVDILLTMRKLIENIILCWYNLYNNQFVGNTILSCFLERHEMFVLSNRDSRYLIQQYK